MIYSEPRSVHDSPVLAALVARMGAQAGPMLSTDTGWDEIIAEADARLAELDPNYTVDQIKEKFGGLRFYYHSSIRDTDLREAMSAIVREAEERAAQTCEMSGRGDGALGRWRGHSWLRTLSVSLYGPQGFEPLEPSE
jgi:hypothetical protein